MKKNRFVTSVVIILTVSVVLFWIVRRVGVCCNVTDSQIIYLYPETTLVELEDVLREGKLLKYYPTFKLVSALGRLDGNIKPGRYKVDKGMGNRDLVRLFKYGLQEPHNLTIAGRVRDMESLAAIIASKTISDSTEVLATLNSSRLIDSLGFSKESFLALFSQNSYQIYWTSSPLSIVKRLHKEYLKFWDGKRSEKAEQLGLTPVEVTTLASIIEEETNLLSEYKVIAGVYLNRLKRDMPLQADPTVKFAVGDHTIKRVLTRHLTVDSPYNTYKYSGLPPGPISIASSTSVDAVLNYQKHNYLYFCADASLNGSHNFATNYSEHLRNARAYQRAISKLGL